MKKSTTDILSMCCTLAAIITGLILHKQVHHLHIYDDATLWTVHEIIGLALTVLVGMHCCQHSAWFSNYAKIQVKRKRVTSIFLIVSIIVLITGIVLMAGSESNVVSRIHYIGGLIFFILAVGHVIKRWNIFKSIINSKK